MHFDANRATLVASPSEMDALVDHVAEHGADSPIELWIDGGLTNYSGKEGGDSVLHPTVMGIAEVLGQPLRSVIIERFDGQIAVPMFVALDGRGRATITEGLGPDSLAVIATDLTLLPTLLSQSLRLGGSAGLSLIHI